MKLAYEWIKFFQFSLINCDKDIFPRRATSVACHSICGEQRVRTRPSSAKARTANWRSRAASSPATRFTQKYESFAWLKQKAGCAPSSITFAEKPDTPRRLLPPQRQPGPTGSACPRRFQSQTRSHRPSVACIQGPGNHGPSTKNETEKVRTPSPSLGTLDRVERVLLLSRLRLFDGPLKRGAGVYLPVTISYHFSLW